MLVDSVLFLGLQNVSQHPFFFTCYYVSKQDVSTQVHNIKLNVLKLLLGRVCLWDRYDCCIVLTRYNTSSLPPHIHLYRGRGAAITTPKHATVQLQTMPCYFKGSNLEREINTQLRYMYPLRINKLPAQGDRYSVHGAVKSLSNLCCANWLYLTEVRFSGFVYCCYFWIALSPSFTKRCNRTHEW